ncbi:HIT domain-containing protein [Lysobacter xanthus]
MSGWSLHPQLEADTAPVASLDACDVRLMDDARWPWLILVPRIAGATEWIDLDRATQHRLSDEIALASTVLRGLHAPDKLNVAALGNMVPQLHVHVIARFRHDTAWPRPVWGVGEAQRYDAETRSAQIARLHEALSRTR